MTNTEIAWARMHDWYISYDYSTKTMMVKDDMVAGAVMYFTNWIKLKNWAGY